jgi:hypothetical protein
VYKPYNIQNLGDLKCGCALIVGSNPTGGMGVHSHYFLCLFCPLQAERL